MDIAQADELRKEKGHYVGPYKTVTLRWLLQPGRNEPYYIFGTGDRDGGWNFVGICSQMVQYVTN